MRAEDNISVGAVREPPANAMRCHATGVCPKAVASLDAGSFVLGKSPLVFSPDLRKGCF